MIAAEGEQKASRALREASEVLCESSAALQLRYLQVSDGAGAGAGGAGGGGIGAGDGGGGW